VASSCATLYRVTTVKRTGRTFVAVDGGMADNLDAALTGQGFEATLATRMTAEPDEITQLSAASASPVTCSSRTSRCPGPRSAT
jgi:Diaminopimelate decarboxylase